MLPIPISTRYPGGVNGADVSFFCEAGGAGGIYYANEDKPGRLIRATEWLCTELARHLGILTPHCAVLCGQDGLETFFGSRQVSSLASRSALDVYLNTPMLGELGQPIEWLKRYFSALFAYDMFVHNIDRSRLNFLLGRDGFSNKLYAFDFASSDLVALSGTVFPVANHATVWVGRFHRQRHGFDLKAALEMTDRIAAVPADTIASFLRPMPSDWMGESEREQIARCFSGGVSSHRLMALRAGLSDESLL